MKKVILCILVALFCLTVNAEVKREGNTFKVERTSNKTPDTQTQYVWEDSKGNQYPIYITKNGACYVIRVSKKTGKEYKQYLSKKVKAEIHKALGYENNN